MRAAEVAAGGWVLPEPAPHTPGEPLTVAWVTVPPSATSGGHTTMFRLIGALEEAGHTCVVYLDDRHGWDIEQHRSNLRAWLPNIRAEVRDVRAGIEDAHVIFATSWQTAYPVLASPALGARCYCVADFEPSFYPAGSEALLAEATYRFGFHAVTHGGWLAQMLRRDYGMQTDHFDFGCDLETYALDRSPGADSRRTGICYYCRPSTPRRAHELAIATLDLFAARHPEVDIHFYGEPPGKLPFRGDRPRLPEPRAAQRALQPLRRRPGAVGHQRLARAARDARQRLHPGGQRRRAQPHRARQRPRRLRAGDAVRAGQRAQRARRGPLARARRGRRGQRDRRPPGPTPAPSSSGSSAGSWSSAAPRRRAA